MFILGYKESHFTADDGNVVSGYSVSFGSQSDESDNSSGYVNCKTYWVKKSLFENSNIEYLYNARVDVQPAFNSYGKLIGFLNTEGK